MVAACKKSSNSPAAPNEPATSTQWTFDNTLYKGFPAQWSYDSTDMAGYLSTTDSTDANELYITFLVSGPSLRPSPGKYYFVNSNGTNIPSGIQLNQICIMEVGPTSNMSSSVGGSPGDTATVTFNANSKMVVNFSNVTVTGGVKVSGTLVE